MTDSGESLHHVINAFSEARCADTPGTEREFTDVARDFDRSNILPQLQLVHPTVRGMQHTCNGCRQRSREQSEASAKGHRPMRCDRSSERIHAMLDTLDHAVDHSIDHSIDIIRQPWQAKPTISADMSQ